MMKKTNEKSKINKCQVFTPKNYAIELLDSVGYCKKIVNKKILENSFGNGNILVEIVERYIKEAIELEYSNEKIKIGLENNIYGFEIDEKQFEKCLYKLNLTTKKKGILNVKWKLYNEDYLRSEISERFDFIVGNPPYITYSDLPIEERIFIREKYETCKQGKFDYCYAFIEHSIKLLSSKGKMSYLIPSSIFKTVFGDKLREYMNPFIITIKDYTKEKIFDNALVKSAIVIMDKKYNSKNIQYLDMSSKKKLLISKTELKKKWIFSNELNMGNNRFGNYFKVSHVIATLLNKAYVIKEENYEDMGNYYKVGNINIEKDIVFPTASPRTMRQAKTEKIIFPYKYINNTLVKLEEDELKKQYPGAFVYLSQFENELKSRKSDKNAKWFEYGRSQALLGIKCEKLLISTIVTDRVFVYKLSEDCIPYGGMYISTKEENTKYDLNFAKKILESKKFINYTKKIGININGNSLRITSKDIEDFYF